MMSSNNNTKALLVTSSSTIISVVVFLLSHIISNSKDVHAFSIIKTNSIRRYHNRYDYDDNQTKQQQFLTSTTTRINMQLYSQNNDNNIIDNMSISIPETYPIARKKLIQKAREIDPNLFTSSTKGSYSSVGWSNRLGTVLTPVSIPGVYTACRPFYWNNIDVGCRMTVIELPSTSSTSSKPDLFIHSPVQLDTPLRQAIDKLGTVKYVVSPNYEHVKYAKMWNDIYPNAFMIACPGLTEREPNVNWKNEIPYGYRPLSFYNDNSIGSSSSSTSHNDMEGMWDYDIIQPLHIDMELNPFTNKPFFNEVVFYHKPSKTLLTTDTYWNYPKSDGVTNSNYYDYTKALDKREDDKKEKEDPFVSFNWELAPSVEKIPFGTRLWKIGMDKLFRPFYLGLMIRKDKKKEFKKVSSFISGINYKGKSSSWDVETVIPAHGDIIRGSSFVRQVLKDHFDL